MSDNPPIKPQFRKTTSMAAQTTYTTGKKADSVNGDVKSSRRDNKPSPAASSAGAGNVSRKAAGGRTGQVKPATSKTAAVRGTAGIKRNITGKNPMLRTGTPRPAAGKAGASGPVSRAATRKAGTQGAGKATAAKPAASPASLGSAASKPGQGKMSASAGGKTPPVSTKTPPVSTKTPPVSTKTPNRFKAPAGLFPSAANPMRKTKVMNRLNIGLLSGLVLVLVLAFTVGGNFANWLTGGSFAHGWYSSEGVYGRLYADKTDEDLAPAVPSTTTSHNAVAEPMNQENNPLNITPAQHYVTNRTPFTNGTKKPAPNGAITMSEFVAANGKIYCTLGSSVTCTVYDYKPAADSAKTVNIRYQLSSGGASTGQILSSDTNPPTGTTPLSDGTSATNGTFACIASGGGVNCWDVNTGRGFNLTPTSASAYNPQIRYTENWRTYLDFETDENNRPDPSTFQNTTNGTTSTNGINGHENDTGNSNGGNGGTNGGTSPNGNSGTIPAPGPNPSPETH